MNNIETIRALYDAFSKGNLPAILERLSDDVEWEHDSFDHAIPWLEKRRGRKQVVGFFESISGLEFKRFEVLNLLAGGDQVVAVVDVEHVHKGTGKHFKDLELHLWTFDEHGQITRFRHVLDTHQLLLQNQP